MKSIILAAGAGYFLKDNYINLIHSGRSNITSEEINRTSDNKQLRYYKKNGIEVECLNNGRDPNCDKYVFRAVLTAVLNEPIGTHIKALFDSWEILYFSGGASNFRNYIRLKGNSLVVDFQQEKYQGFDSIIRLLNKSRC